MAIEEYEDVSLLNCDAILTCRQDPAFLRNTRDTSFVEVLQCNSGGILE